MWIIIKFRREKVNIHIYFLNTKKKFSWLYKFFITTMNNIINWWICCSKKFVFIVYWKCIVMSLPRCRCKLLSNNNNILVCARESREMNIWIWMFFSCFYLVKVQYLCMCNKFLRKRVKSAFSDTYVYIYNKYSNVTWSVGFDT